MQILRKENLEVAIIDRNKKFGEDGQYLRFRADCQDFKDRINIARAKNFEIRYYVEKIGADDGGVVTLKYVITEIPPMHVQPFHSHTNIDEINLVDSGEVYFIESQTLTENDTDEIKKQGILLKAGDVVVSGFGKRHTVANFSSGYARLIGTISAKSSAPDFKPDWE